MRYYAINYKNKTYPVKKIWAASAADAWAKFVDQNKHGLPNTKRSDWVIL